MIWIWVGFIVFVLGVLAFDLFVVHRKDHAVSLKESLGWSAVWVALALLFSVFVYLGYEHHWLGLGTRVDEADGVINNGAEATVKYITGYVVEKTLSVDNIFVFSVLFTGLAIPAMYQHRVLFWGILSALVMRGLMIGIGAELIARYHWILYVFGLLLVLTALKMLFVGKSESDGGKHRIVRWARRWLPVSEGEHGNRFLVRVDGEWQLTTLAVALVAVEVMDAVFAVDSIPAIFGITADPFLVFSSNVFAMLGLRSLYFALAGMVEKFRYLKVALAVVLCLIGVKMLAAKPLEAWLQDNFHYAMLAAVVLVLAAGIVASIVWPQKGAQHA